MSDSTLDDSRPAVATNEFTTIAEYAALIEKGARTMHCNDHWTVRVRHFAAINRNLAQWVAQHPNVRRL